MNKSDRVSIPSIHSAARGLHSLITHSTHIAANPGNSMFSIFTNLIGEQYLNLPFPDIHEVGRISMDFGYLYFLPCEFLLYKALSISLWSVFFLLIGHHYVDSEHNSVTCADTESPWSVPTSCSLSSLFSFY